MIRFWCSCGRQLQASESAIGEEARCPLCQRVNVVPAHDMPRKAAVAAVPGRGWSRDEAPDEITPGDSEVESWSRGPFPGRPSPPAHESSGLATASFVLGVLSFPFLLSVVTSIPALITGVLALCDRRVRTGERAGRGGAITGIILACLGLIALVPLYFYSGDLGKLISGTADRKVVTTPRDRPDGKPDAGQQANRMNVSQNIWLEVDGDQRRVLVSAEVCLREGILEQLLTRKGQKEHEAVLAADIDARKLHQALLLAGATAGSPVRFDPIYRPATGTPIRVSIRYAENGQQKTVSARSWIRNQKTGAELDCDWVFAGSMLVDNPFDPSAPKQFLANEGDVICVSNFEAALLDVPIMSSKGNEEHSYEAWTQRIPPLHTKVVVVLEPVLPKKK